MQDGQKNKWKGLLRTVNFFAPFSDHDLDSLLAIGTIRRYNKDEFIVREDITNYSFYVILRGTVGIVKEVDMTQKKVIAELKDGDCFGEIAVLLDGSRSASVITTAETFLFIINGKEIENLHKDAQLILFRQIAVNLAIKLKGSSEKIAKTA